MELKNWKKKPEKMAHYNTTRNKMREKFLC